jgi:large subunit ribosomal protein L4e
MKTGPLVVVHDRDCKVAKALRNVPGVDVGVASALDLRMLAPGAHLGRLVVWT